MKHLKWLILIALFFLSACAVTPAEWERAEKLCAPNGGVNDYTSGLYGEVRCTNGVIIRFRTS